MNKLIDYVLAHKEVSRDLGLKPSFTHEEIRSYNNIKAFMLKLGKIEVMV